MYYKTKFMGVYYRFSKANDKIFYIRYNRNKRQVEERIGIASQGVTEKFAANVRIERLSIASPIQKKYLFNEMINMYIDNINAVQKNQKDVCRIEKYIRPYFANMQMSEITTSEILRFKNIITSKRNYAPQTIKHYIIIIRQIFNFAIRMGYYDGDNPAQANKINLPKFDNSRNTYMTDDEIDRYISVCKSGQLRQHESALFLFALYTGMRKSEMLKLTWSEVHIDDKYVRLVDTKSSKNHIVIISESALDILRELLAGKKSDYVFTHINGLPLKDVRALWEKIKRLANIRQEVRIHDIRHTFGTQAVTAGVPLDVLQKMMTHSDIKTTQRYAHIVDKRLHEAAATIDSIYKKKP